jgi:hypothetical protein
MSEQTQRKPATVHPVVIEIAAGVAIWFLAVTWLSFAKGGEVDWDLVVATLFFVIFFSLLLLTASFAARDPRWSLGHTSFRDFLHGEVSTATGTMRGRDVLVEILLVPVSLALAATAIGLVFVLWC